jgi:hypothetical protein
MNTLYIHDLKYCNMPLLRSEFKTYIISKLTALNIKANVRLSDSGLYFVTNSDSKLFVSTVMNKTVMNSNDPRIAKLGRDYLESTRLTKKQCDALVNLFFVELPKMFNISITDENSTKFVVNSVVVGQWRIPNSFPVENNI